MKMLMYSLLASLALTPVAFANPTINTPSGGAYVGSPFTLSASAATCSSQSVGAMAYSIDSGADVVTVNAQVLDVQVTSPLGAHTVHVKAWGTAGAGCVTDVAVNVTTGTNPAVSSPSSGATVVSPFTLTATDSVCSSQSVSSMAYSIDSGSILGGVNAQSINTQVTASIGAHTLHIKSWGSQGSACYTDVPVNVESSGGVTVSNPSSGETVNTPFTLSGTSSTCSGQSVSAMAYSIDSGANLVTVNAQSINTQVQSAAGAHTLHVKSWGTGGAGCNTDVAVAVLAPTGPVIPSTAISVSNIQTMSNWKLKSDPVMGGTSTGSLKLVSYPAYSGTTLQTSTTFTNGGGELYHVTIGDDTTSKNFVYDVWVYLANTTNSLANLEMDLNQVMPNGQTVIYGFQCDGYSKTWDYTINAGTPSAPIDEWVHSSQVCNTSTWTQNAWHHIQIAYSRDDSGVVTYQNVYLDGVQSPINATVPSAFALGWGPSLLANFQVDGRGSSGQITIDVDNMTIYRW